MAVNNKRKLDFEEEGDEDYSNQNGDENYDENYEDDGEYYDEEGEGEETDKNTNSTSQPEKKKFKSEKKSKATVRQEKVERKTKIDKFFPIVNDAKLIWIKLKESKKDKAARVQLSQELFNKLKGNMLNIVLKHDASRFIQTLLKYGTHDQRLHIFNELKGHEILISKGHYGRFLVLKLLKYGDKEHRNRIIQTYYGKIFNLISHKESAHIVEYIYAEIADKQQKTAIIEEFYGNEFRLFKPTEPRTLTQYLEANPGKKDSLMNNLTASLTKLLSAKGDHLAKFTIIHHILNEFFKHATSDNCVDMAETLAPIILPMAHTKEGAMVCYYVVSYGSPKTRKTIAKSLKGFLAKIAESEFGHLFLVRLLDVADDTLLLTKSVIAELISDLPALATNKYGYLWIMHILSPYSKQHFNEHQIALLTPTMKSSSATEEAVISKKDRASRRNELLAFILPKLTNLATTQTEDLLKSTFGIRVLNYTIQNEQSKKKLIIDKLVSSISDEILKNHGPNIQYLLKQCEPIKTNQESLQQLLEKFQWIDLCVKDANAVFVYRDLLNCLPDSNSAKSSAVKGIIKSKKQLESTKFPGVSSLFNLKPNPSK